MPSRGTLPVDQLWPGQLPKKQQTSTAWVMESPMAAIESGRGGAGTAATAAGGLPEVGVAEAEGAVPRGASTRATPTAIRRRLGSGVVALDPALLDHALLGVGGGAAAVGGEAAPEQQGQEQADHAGDHQDDADGVDVEALRADVDREGQDGPDDQQEDAGSDAHCASFKPSSMSPVRPTRPGSGETPDPDRATLSAGAVNSPRRRDGSHQREPSTVRAGGAEAISGSRSWRAARGRRRPAGPPRRPG